MGLLAGVCRYLSMHSFLGKFPLLYLQLSELMMSFEAAAASWAQPWPCNPRPVQLAGSRRVLYRYISPGLETEMEIIYDFFFFVFFSLTIDVSPSSFSFSRLSIYLAAALTGLHLHTRTQTKHSTKVRAT